MRAAGWLLILLDRAILVPNIMIRFGLNLDGVWSSVRGLLDLGSCSLELGSKLAKLAQVKTQFPKRQARFCKDFL
ncbi:MAG: hypothetical protein GY874_12835 [Desulfobacteraceae bacterium]|nr:hypothetical protein [Desulfobacteraceae bacterium]